MSVRVEWRTRGEMDDAILVVDAVDNTVSQELDVNAETLRDFLNDMAALAAWRLQRPVAPVDSGQRDPQAWGELVMARAPTGEVITMNPELYWDGVYLWFRSRGVDPHAMRG